MINDKKNKHIKTFSEFFENRKKNEPKKSEKVDWEVRKTQWLSSIENLYNTVDIIIINNFKILIAKERAILSLASNTEDEGTVSLMSDYISQTEKTLWMLNSYMS